MLLNNLHACSKLTVLLNRDYLIFHNQTQLRNEYLSKQYFVKLSQENKGILFFTFPSSYSWICNLCPCGYVPFLAFVLSFHPVGRHSHPVSLQFISNFVPVFPSQKIDIEQNYAALCKSQLLNPVITFFFACSSATDFKYKREKWNAILQPSCRLCHMSGLCKFIQYWGMISLKLMSIRLFNLRIKQAMHLWVSKKKVIYWFRFIKAVFAIPAPLILC